MKWIKPTQKLPEVSGIGLSTMSNYVAVHIIEPRHRYGKDEMITVSGRYCHDRKCWFLPAYDKREVVEWLDET